MPRPRKTGLEYFPLDCQMDDKIEMLEAEHGMEGFGVYIRLLQHCYQQEDGKLDMSVVFRWKTLGKTLGILPENLRKMVDTMLEIGLFDRKTFDEQQQLTSNGIQKRLDKVATLRQKERQRKSEPDSDPKPGFSGGKQELSGRNSTQKEKESKKESKEEKERLGGDSAGADAPTTTEPVSSLPSSPSLVPPSQQPAAAKSPPVARHPPKPDLETRRDAFKESVRDYYRNNRSKYPDTMYPAFIAYWAESDGKKMRWEKETVFEIPNRLSTWHQRETKSVAPNKTLQVNGNGRNTRTEPTPGQPFGKL